MLPQTLLRPSRGTTRREYTRPQWTEVKIEPQPDYTTGVPFDGKRTRRGGDHSLFMAGSLVPLIVFVIMVVTSVFAYICSAEGLAVLSFLLSLIAMSVAITSGAIKQRIALIDQQRATQPKVLRRAKK